MFSALSSWGGTIIVAGFCIVVARFYWEQLFEEDRARGTRELLVWLFKGFLLPVGLWFGLIWANPGGSKVVAALGDLTPPALLVISSFWAAITLGWLLTLIWMTSSSPRDLIPVNLFWFILLLPLVWLVLKWNGLGAIGFGVLIWLVPMVHFSTPFLERKERGPSYSSAIAKLKFGKYNEAEWEVIRQLEQKEDDFEGWMMLAEIHANHFRELQEADATVRALCEDPKITPVQISVALHRMADWHLKLGQDPTAARAALQEICRRFPGTHLARMARQRIDHIPATREEYLESCTPRKVRLPALSEGLDQAEHAGQTSPVSTDDALAAANKLILKLQENPNDIRPREQLAHLLAEQMNHPEQGIEQLQLLVDMPEVSVEKKAEWLASMAAWQIRLRQDKPAGRLLLERLVREFPQSPQAFAAQRRLFLMDFEAVRKS